MQTFWKAYFSIVSAMLVLTTLVSVSNSNYDRRRVQPDDPPPSNYRRRPPMRKIVAYSAVKQLALQRKETVVCNATLDPPQGHQLDIDNDYWQTVVGSHLSVYSAHLDDRTVNHKFVRILAMGPGDEADKPFYCQIWFDDASSKVVEAGVANMWPAHWDPGRRDNPSDPFMLTCEVEDFDNSSTLPRAVSVGLSPCGTASTLLRLEFKDADPKSDFVVCVKGMVSPSDVSIRLVEWLELNVLLGAKQFFFYVYDVHSRVRKVLEFYSRKGLVTLADFSLPPGQPNDPEGIRRFIKDNDNRWQKRRNELIPYNDCYYRNLRASRFVIPLDLDEVIIPVKTHTWSKMFGELQDENPALLRQYSSFTVRNAFFLDFFPGNDRDSLHMLSHLTRSAEFGRGEQNGKSFIRTSSSLTIFNHFTLKTLTPETSQLVVLDTAVAQMNHYRGDCDEEFMDRCDEFRNRTIRDGIVLKYMKMLKSNVKQRLRQLFFNNSSHIY